MAIKYANMQQKCQNLLKNIPKNYCYAFVIVKINSKNKNIKIN